MNDIKERFEVDPTLLVKDGSLADMSRDVSSKYMNFFLTYQCDKGNLLDPMIENITNEIHEWERHDAPDDGIRYPRINRRAAVPNRRFKSAVRQLILNLLQVAQIETDDISLAVSLDANTYTQKGNRYSPHDMTYDPFIEAYNGLEALGYFEVKHKGYFDPFEGHGMCTKIVTSDRLSDLYDWTKKNARITFFNRPLISADKDELIILKGEHSRAKGIAVKLQYTDTKQTNKWRSNLKRINKTISKHEIAINCSSATYQDLVKALRNKKIADPEQLTDIDQSSKRLHRIFSDGQFDHGGRFYHGWWQQVPQAYRKYITIDGQETCELDYSRLHISMCYAQLGITMYSDPYAIHPKVSEAITKYAINAMLNAKDIVKQHKDFDSKKSRMSWKRFIELIAKQHSPLVENGMWANGYGLKLQYLDSVLAETILLHFSKQDIPCLPIHDSFIVPIQHRDELNLIMKSTYFDNFGTDINVKEK